MDFDLILQIITIIGIDIILGGDNAIVIALASRKLPEDKRHKAIVIGTGLAIIVRILLTIVVVLLLQIPYLQLIGAIFLIWIAIQLLIHNEDETTHIKGGKTLFEAIRTIVLADLVMGFDNVIAIAGAAHGEIWLVITGLLISVPIIIWGSKIILHCIERFPTLVYVGAGILAYTASKMIIHEKQLHPYFESNPTFETLIPFILIITVLSFGGIGNIFAKA
ncbi:TerC family protein [Bacillus solimangrovi]|uniref:YjbE family integral membrane protein n=1 Tax=Bacillus solimangrovi TaxID=1305675 RepID=A0A1E5LC13_9BACI|nr:TerC family protein [Bacillus solimangrovi]OEH91614.1 hypothetical protein BFG57_04375 [Bacillus solimangrovi]